ncbi:glucose-6-phosphate 1-dehydrogenase Zwf [Peptoclostridium acidaminophilum DSM 3953]|uniref:Glucose-6-phosphate 1-dehydrogenase n=1 Tax=Peptoclostridium acidaminophilum DSM 3953 TaxID=1286171 RepID=W8U7T0_PEPAC|nr:glucose-6-phosphate dehydrogenase [Peptoclostridium acidaminophilum]AHM56941.1 glucose-6-phosphate 1-dehydrogenase Zwf [Peptoclostridium acidaminophilum DSM 3953]
MSIIVVFGGTGDLGRKKLIPDIYNLYFENNLPQESRVVTVGRSIRSEGEYKESVRECISRYSRLGYDEDVWRRFEKIISYRQFDFNDIEGYRKLETELAEIEKECGRPLGRLFYLATSHDFFGPIVEKLRDSGLANGRDSFRRLIVEKPFGRDIASARSLNAVIRSVFEEEDIYRIDHYLGNEMIQNILSLRFSNSMLEQVWNSSCIDNIQISILEEAGVEGREEYYESSGVLRDMVQNHIIQLISLVMMEPPVSLAPEDIKEQKLKVIKSICNMTPEDIGENVVLGQYAEGTIKSEGVKGYRSEKGVPEDSVTATFAALRLFVENSRWNGVPVYVRTGKRLNNKLLNIAVEFKNLSSVYGAEAFVDSQPNLLSINILPEESISLQFHMKKPGRLDKLEPFEMSFFKNQELKSKNPETYERLIYDAIRGDSTRYAGWDEIESSWRIVEDILDTCEKRKECLHFYSAGSSGPNEAERLLERDGRRWLGDGNPRK